MSKILYVVDNPNNWINYAPALVKLARDNHASISILENEGLYGPFLSGDHFAEMTSYLQSAGLTVDSHHSAQMTEDEVEHYALGIGADIIAHAKLGFLERLFGESQAEVDHSGLKHAFLKSSV